MMKHRPTAAAFLFALVATAAAAWEDRFDAMEPSGVIPGWNVQAIDWAPGRGTLNYTGGAYAFALPAALPSGDEAAAEVTLRIARRAAPGWALAGIAIRQDDRNYWHLALCEAPPENGSRRFIELSEKLDDVWLAQSAAATRLAPTAAEGLDFAWTFDHDYRLRIAIRDGVIDATVAEMDGTVRMRAGYRLEGRSVSWGAPALCANAVAATFDDFRGDTAKPRELPAEVLPAYDATAGRKIDGAATGFFHTRRIDGKDWLIDPLGRLFYWVGTDHASYRGHWCEKLGYQPYGRVTEKKYGGEAVWADATLARLKTWGFNTLPTGYSPSLLRRGLAHIKFLSLGAGFAGRDWIVPKKHWTGFPNVFSAEWPRHCEVVAARECATQKNDPWLIGYFLDNELEWFGPDWRKNGLFEAAWLLPPDHSAKQAWIRFLQERKRSIADVNRLFGTSFADFAALAADVKPPECKGDEAAALSRAWVRLVAEKYFGTAAAAIRRHDPNHLLLGCRFAGDAPDVLDIAGAHNDIVSLNTYPRIDVERGVPEAVLKMIEEFHARCGKPMAITEWSFPALDAGLPSLHGAGMRVDTQEQRAKCFSHFQEFLFRLPFVVGSSYFMFLDEPALGISSTFPEDSNYGLVRENDEPYVEITAAATKLNHEVYRLHQENRFRPAALPEPVRIPAWLRETKNRPEPPGAEIGFRRGAQSFAFSGAKPAWRIALNDRPAVDIFPVVHRLAGGQHAWLHPQSARIVAQGGNERADSVDVAFAFDGARAAIRYWIPREGAGWIASSALWVENSAAQPWQLDELFHYNTPVFGDPARIESISPPTAYYRRDAAWVDRANRIILGCWVPESASVEAVFWKDGSGGFHSDAREKIERVLAPGGRWTAPVSSPPFFHFAIPGERPADYHAACDAIAAALAR